MGLKDHKCTLKPRVFLWLAGEFLRHGERLAVIGLGRDLVNVFHVLDDPFFVGHEDSSSEERRFNHLGPEGWAKRAVFVVARGYNLCRSLGAAPPFLSEGEISAYREHNDVLR